jgi:large subunit ribosomal protein L13Ae
LFRFFQRLSHEVGWSYRDVVDRLEEKRKVKTAAFHERKVCLLPRLDLTRSDPVLPLQVAALKIRTQALKDATAAAPISEKLAVYGQVDSETPSRQLIDPLPLHSF